MKTPKRTETSPWELFIKQAMMDNCTGISYKKDLFSLYFIEVRESFNRIVRISLAN